MEVTPEVHRLPLEVEVQLVPEEAYHLPAEPFPASFAVAPYVSSGTISLILPDKTVLGLLYPNVVQPEA